MIGMWIFFVLPVFKCSVSCGTGIQVRKIDCILPASSNASHSDYLHSGGGTIGGGGGGGNNVGIDGVASGSRNIDANIMVNGNNNDEKIDHIETLSDASSNGRNIVDPTQILVNEQISMDCDPKLKPIATQSCTTGIECTTIINDNIGSYSHEESDRITSASSENENDNENDNVNENLNGHENDNTAVDSDNENVHLESENVEATEDVNVDQSPIETSVEVTNEQIEEDADASNENASVEANAGTVSEEVEEIEVFWGSLL